VMQSPVHNIGIIEPSDLLYEGLTNLLLKYRSGLRLYRIVELDDYYRSIPHIDFDLIILNTTLIQNRIKTFRNLKRDKPGIRWIGIIYTLINTETLTEFDDIIRIDEPSEAICNKIFRLSDAKPAYPYSPQQKTLTDRETDVLKLLSGGLSNKEIADNLNISIHTVISHRKNISQKTGIKSQSGLTIYALSNNIISLDNLQSSQSDRLLG
jgi:DNA-binding CsgD family transcriptional regulator